jgi:hypothetical protein
MTFFNQVASAGLTAFALVSAIAARQRSTGCPLCARFLPSRGFNCLCHDAARHAAPRSWSQVTR